MKKYKKEQEQRIFEEELHGYNDIKEPCLNKLCIECHGTGKKKDGTLCIHFISCSCSKCTPRV